MPLLDGSAAEVPLAPDIVISAPGLVGQADLEFGPPLGGRDGEPPRATEGFAAALAASGLQQAFAVVVSAAEVPGAEAPTRSPDGRSGLVLDVPDLGPERGQVVLLADEEGVLSWHFPVGRSGTAVRGGGSLRFVVPRDVAVGSPVDGAELGPSDRSLVTAIGRKVLSVLVYPIVRDAVGVGAEALMTAYERRRRPHLARTFLAANRHLAGAGELDGAGWQRLAEGRALLLLHGTFSTSQGGFGGLPDDILGTLTAAYDGRVLAFDHPTTSVDPAVNAAELLARIPPGVQLDVDVVAHSRGGLVARTLAGELTGSTPALTVGKIVFVGTPNAGTALADQRHMGAFIDRYTSLLNLLPPGPWSTVTDVLETILEVVKLLGQGLLVGLPGLRAMDPTGNFIQRLNAAGGGPAQHYAVAADFTPAGSLARLVNVPNLLADRVFGAAENDMVVPTLGVGTVEGDPGFPIDEAHRLHFPGDQAVWHCSYFCAPDTGKRLTAWLTG